MNRLHEPNRIDLIDLSRLDGGLGWRASNEICRRLSVFEESWDAQWLTFLAYALALTLLFLAWYALWRCVLARHRRRACRHGGGVDGSGNG